MTRLLFVTALVAALGAQAPAASADTLGTRANQRGVITQIDKGVFQLGLDSTLQVNWLQEGEGAASRSNLTGNAMLRYFIRPKLGVSGRLGGLYRKDGETRDVGFIGSAWANYFMRLGEGMFFAPGVGAGLAVGQRDVPVGVGMVGRESLVGGLLGGELLAAMYLSPRFSLTGGPSFSLMFGSAGDSFVELNGSFKVGAVYSF